MENKPFWKTTQGMVLIGGGGAILLGTLWLVASTMWPAPPIVAAAPVLANHVDENALVAANAERPGETANSAAPATGAKPAAAPATVTPASASTDKPPERFNPNDIAAEAQQALDDAQDQIDEPKPELEENDPGK